MAGLYIHIPFCASRCIYCGFYSTTGKENLQDRYVRAIIEEYNQRKDYLRGDKIETIYFGGGTPSLLSNQNFRLLGEHINNIECKDIKEFTIECNPNDITPALCRSLKDIGVNRVSMGVQTFSNNRLRFLHRRHKSEDIAPAVEMLRDNGISNISIDLMFGFPDETLEEWSNDITKALALNVEHISAYSLMYEEGTPLYSMLKEGLIKENTEGSNADMYEILIDRLIEAGYDHYEISNFSKSGKASIHNSSYWNETKYIGLGAAAHSYDGSSRQWNVSDLERYINGIENHNAKIEIEEIDDNTRYNDLVTTALRTKKGINLSNLSKEHYIYIKRNARKSIENGLLKIDDNHIHLTRKGLFISDSIMSDLIFV
ncbi:MAG: radical SAM family heme chaperone HemW [Prevotella sp.]|nr:radical SAM family heme chaperone HemW [Candidatus Prevotella equi]